MANGVSTMIGLGVKDFYDQYLNRQGGANELDYWQSQLDSGAMSLDQIASSIVGSSEYQNKAAASTTPFNYVDHDNDYLTKPVLGNNANSSIGFGYTTGGPNGNGATVYSTGTDGQTFKPFEVSGQGSTYGAVNAPPPKDMGGDFSKGWEGFDGTFDDYVLDYMGNNGQLDKWASGQPKTSAVGVGGANDNSTAAGAGTALSDAVNNEAKAASTSNKMF